MSARLFGLTVWLDWQSAWAVIFYLIVIYCSILVLQYYFGMLTLKSSKKPTPFHINRVFDDVTDKFCLYSIGISRIVHKVPTGFFVKRKIAEFAFLVLVLSIPYIAANIYCKSRNLPILGYTQLTYKFAVISELPSSFMLVTYIAYIYFINMTSRISGRARGRARGRPQQCK